MSASPADHHAGRGGSPCYAAQLGGCEGKASADHFISRALLEQFEPRLQVTGFDPRDPTRTALVSRSTLVAKVLCEGHNARLSQVDAAGSQAAVDCRDFDHALGAGGPKRAAATRHAQGLVLERWVAKVGLDLLHRRGSQTQLDPTKRAALLGLVFDGQPLPDPWGLYLEAAPGSLMFSGYDVAAEVRVHPQTQQAMAMSVSVGSIRWLVALGRPDQLPRAAYRPSAVVLTAADGRRSRTLRLSWDGVPGPHDSVGLTRVN